MSTANAYSKVIVKQPDTPLEKLLSLPMDKWKDFIDNAFESYVSTQLTIVNEIKSELYNAGAIFVSMSGSGSALYSFSSKELNLSSLEKQNIVWKSILSFK